MKTTNQASDKKAFSLVELSIVLVILGLLVGGVLTGQSLIRAAELRSISTDQQRYATAVGTFRDKYFAIPGDMGNASSFWSTAGNGNSDGNIANTATAGTNEISTFWIHLANAGLVEGSYTNVANTTLTAGVNVPRAKISSAGWDVAFLGTVSVAGVVSPDPNTTDPAASTFYDGNYGNVFILGGGTNALLPTGILKSEEAWNVDTKMDDGRPAMGSVVTLESQGSATAGAGCGNLATDNAATRSASAYDLVNTSSTACAFVFKMGY